MKNTAALLYIANENSENQIYQDSDILGFYKFNTTKQDYYSIKTFRQVPFYYIYSKKYL